MVRRLIGYDRYQSKEALEQLNRVYTLVERYVSFFQLVMELQDKQRRGARVHKVYDTARTPYRKLLEHGGLSDEGRDRLSAEYAVLNPVKLLGQIKKEQERLWVLAENQPGRPAGNTRI